MAHPIRYQEQHCLHRNPLKRGLVQRPEDSKWSSYRYYAFGEPGVVKVNAYPPSPKAGEDGAPGKVTDGTDKRVQGGPPAQIQKQFNSPGEIDKDEDK